jgi:hypothetical protein
MYRPKSWLEEPCGNSAVIFLASSDLPPIHGINDFIKFLLQNLNAAGKNPAAFLM